MSNQVPIKNKDEFDRAKYEQAFLQLIDRSKISLTPLHILRVIPSTNEYLWSLVEQKQQLPLAAIPLQQTAGRGQWGKTWQSFLGGLYLSVGVETYLRSDYLNLLSNLGQQVIVEGCPGIVSGVTTKGELKVRWRSPGATTEVCFMPGQISLGY